MLKVVGDEWWEHDALRRFFYVSIAMSFVFWWRLFGTGSLIVICNLLSIFSSIDMIFVFVIPSQISRNANRLLKRACSSTKSILPRQLSLMISAGESRASRE